MISEAVTISKPVSRRGAFAGPPRPVTTLRSARSSTSVTRRQVMSSGPVSGTSPRWTAFSVIAPSRLCAEPTAWASPVKWTLISSSGTTRAPPPPVPPPLMPKMGPRDGSRMVTTAFLPILPRPCVRPIAVVVLPSPAGVGLTPVTTTSFPICG